MQILTMVIDNKVASTKVPNNTIHPARLICIANQLGLFRVGDYGRYP